HPHCAPGSLRKILFGFVDELLSAYVFKIVVVALHVQNEQARKTVAAKIGECCISAPTSWPQANLCGYILELVVTDILVENWILISLRMQVSSESIRQPYVLTLLTSLVAGVATHIANQQVEQPIIVVVEENSPGRMADQIEASLFSDVPEV